MFTATSNEVEDLPYLVTVEESVELEKLRNCADSGDHFLQWRSAEFDFM